MAAKTVITFEMCMGDYIVGWSSNNKMKQQQVKVENVLRVCKHLNPPYFDPVSFHKGSICCCGCLKCFVERMPNVKRQSSK